MQETERISVRKSPCFFSVDDVVRHTGYHLGPLRLRTQSTKGTNNRHRSSYRTTLRVDVKGLSEVKTVLEDLQVRQACPKIIMKIMSNFENPVKCFWREVS